jgi:fructosamine-3-kinase
VSEELLAAVAASARAAVVSARPVAGGDVNRAAQVTLADGRCLFVKHRPGAPGAMYRAEADGLAWLRAANALRLPRVVAVGEGEPAFLALEWVERGPPGPGYDERLGRGLAALHRAGAPGFGLAHDNWIGPLPQPNGPCPTWPEFYATRRLQPMARAAAERGLLPARVRAGVERLAGRLQDLCGPPEPPARLHGDLWGGNAMSDAAGEPVLVDPAAYGGHREMDLAMMRLFGGFSERVFAAYAEEFPLAPGHEDRVGLYQLYPLLVHVALFGGAYAGSVERVLERYAGRRSPGGR